MRSSLLAAVALAAAPLLVAAESDSCPIQTCDGVDLYTHDSVFPKCAGDEGCAVVNWWVLAFWAAAAIVACMATLPALYSLLRDPRAYFRSVRVDRPH